MLLESHVYFQIHSLYHKINNRETRDTVTIQKCCMLLLLQRNFDIFRFSITFYFFYCRSRWEAFLSIISAMLFFCWFDRMFFFPFCSFSLSLSLSLSFSLFFFILIRDFYGRPLLPSLAFLSSRRAHVAINYLLFCKHF
jgi:hypothetical protein